jgi:hypothetical protein
MTASHVKGGAINKALRVSAVIFLQTLGQIRRPAAAHDPVRRKGALLTTYTRAAARLAPGGTAALLLAVWWSSAIS